MRVRMMGAVLCLAVAAALLPLQSSAADAVNLEGTWKIVAPQGAFQAEGGAIPFTAQGRKIYQQNKRHQARRDYEQYDYAMARCASPGLPRLMLTPDRFRIWQRPGLIMFLFEWNRLFRQIDMGGLLQLPRVGPGAGQDVSEEIVGRAIPIAKGRWEGDALVASTTGFSATELIDDLVPHGRKLKLTERMRLRDSNTLEDRITIEDPEHFTRPWETVIVYTRQPNDAFPENVCLDRLQTGKQP